jgi:CHAT domain-containing protein
MELFYTNLWEKNLPRLEALRRAQLAILYAPNLVTHRRDDLDRGLEPKPIDLPDKGKIVPPPANQTRSDPSHWAGFILSGDVR